MKDGSGDLDFGGEEDLAEEGPPLAEPEPEAGGSRSADEARDAGTGAGGTGRATDSSSGPRGDSQPSEYPYFVRRNNVTDERTRRLECHVRPDVAQGESDFRSQVASALGTDSVSKTDAREFALKFAFRHPEEVAELMREEGFDVVR